MLILWSHALAALLFGALAFSQLRYARTPLPHRSFTLALAATALWALAVAGIGAADVTTLVAEAMRNLAWLGFLFALERRYWRHVEGGALYVIYVLVAALTVAGGVIGIVEAGLPLSEGALVQQAAMVPKMMGIVGALVLVHHAYQAIATRAPGGMRLVVTGVAALWLGDFLLAAGAYLGAHGSTELLAARGGAVALLAPTFAVAVHRNGDRTLKLSRTLAYQSLILAGAGVYVLAMALATNAIEVIGGDYVRPLQTALVFGSTTAIATILSSPWLRAWAKVKLAKHLFSHRYDYRAEWIGFTDTLGVPGTGAAPLATRIVKAVADLTDSPAGILLVPEGADMGQGAVWNWADVDVPLGEGNSVLSQLLEGGGRIVELDAVRDGSADTAEQAAVPRWMVETAEAWVLVPLIHFGKLVGAILLARPPVDRRPDWEDFDMLRIAGRQVASYLAELRAQEALSEAARFDEFNRRFAFILHDIKNLVSQISLVARNAERHADNPAFRADMIATLQDSAARMNDLLARLAQRSPARADGVGPVPLIPLLERIAANRSAQHRIIVRGEVALVALADVARVEQLVGHLVQNAIDASANGDPVTIMLSSATRGRANVAAIDVIDHGVGMSPAFVRDQLFKAFVSSKPAGFGLGAFEARQLAEAMGGAVEVFSREGEGTRFRVTLPLARADANPLEEAA
ncbi:MAG: XrtA/PEP-CTERM system histidine kinase PrsK [Sphingomonas sp.]